MVTREQIEAALDLEKNNPYQTKGIDHEARVIALLRERIPYKECASIISGAEHNIVYLCGVYKATLYLTEEDLVILADCNCFIHEDNDCITLFV